MTAAGQAAGPEQPEADQPAGPGQAGEADQPGGLGQPGGADRAVAGRGGPVPVVIALGSNLGDRRAHLQAAVDSLAATAGISVTAVSPVYQTAPAGGPDQPDYFNAVLLADTALPPAGVLAAAHAAESARQRTRTVRWGPRTLDVDIISYDALVSADPVLTLPHPRAHQRAFVLVPWHDVDPAADLPGHGPVADLIAGLTRPAGPGGPGGVAVGSEAGGGAAGGGDGLPDGLRRAGAELRRPS